MNLITFNEHFAVVASREGKERFEKACLSPVFDYAAIKPHVHDNIDKLVSGNGQPDSEGDIMFDFQMPFPIMRAEFELSNKATEKPIIRYNLMIFTDVARAYFRVLMKPLKDKVFCIELMQDGLFVIETWSEHRKAWVQIARSNIKNVDSELPAFQVYSQLIGSMVAFAVDAMSPTTHIASVSPPRSGRTVQWVKARTHYTFISHGHPANKAGIQTGACIANDASEELTRMAHNRRAHKKTLRHERYRYKRGQTINVKATWVGPKQWQDEGSKQIYRILEPTDWKPGDPVTCIANDKSFHK